MNLRVPALLAFLAFSYVGVNAQPAPNTITAEQKASVLAELEKVLTQRAFVPGTDFSTWKGFLEKKQEAIDKAENVNTFSSTVNQALRDFGFSHIRFLSPRATSARGQTSTIGMGVGTGPDSDGLVVRSVVEESPAKAVGLEVGDVILKVNGEKPTSSEDLTGNEGDSKKLEVRKAAGDTKELEIQLKRYSTVRKESLTWFGEETAVLKVYTFSTGYGRENIEKLMGEAQKAKHLILDLRSNGGGATNNLNHLLSLFLPDGSAYGTFISKRVYEQYVAANPEGEKTPEAIAAWAPQKTKTRKRGSFEPFPGKVSVLINRGSGSASEICAAALKELKEAKLVGAQSAGAVLASVFIKLPEGFSVQIPVSDYITIKGTRLEGKPLKPDIAESGRIKDGEDPVIKRAIDGKV